MRRADGPSMDGTDGAVSRFVHLTEDKHQQALYRLAAVGQYLYDTMSGDEDSDRPEPLPQMAMECVREAQRQIDLAIKHGQRTRRRCLGGELELLEQPGPQWKGE